jgi:hypothetical protein
VGEVRRGEEREGGGEMKIEIDSISFVPGKFNNEFLSSAFLLYSLTTSSTRD